MFSKTILDRQNLNSSWNIENIISWLTKPSASVNEIEKRFQARLLSALLLAFLILGIVSVTIQQLTVPGFQEIFPVLAVSLLILAIAYILSRTPYYLVSAFIAIITPSIAVFANIISDPSPAVSIMYLLISILLSSILLSWWWTVAIVTINIALASMLPRFVTGLSISDIAPAMGLLAITSGLTLVFIRYRNVLEEKRQTRLTTSERRYRMLINQSPLCTITFEPNGRPQIYNQSAIELWNLSPQDLTHIRETYNILEDEQLAASGVLAFIKQSFTGTSAVAPPTKYEFLRHEDTGKRIVDERWIVSHCYPIKDESDKVLEIVLIQEDITERKRTEAEIEERNRELASLNRAISATNVTLNKEEILQYVCSELTVVLTMPLAVAALLNEEGTEVTVVTAAQPTGSPEIKGTVIEIEPFGNSPLVHQILHRKEPVIISDARHSSDLEAAQHLLEQLNIASLIILPLVVRGTLIGVIGIGTDVQREFDKPQVELAHSIASSISPAINNAQLHEKVQHYAATLAERVRERTGELAEANERLQALANVKDEFVSNVSHELRTPITNIKLYHDLLSLNPQKSDQYVAILKRETDRLEHIVEGLLHLSRLDQGVTDMQLASTDLNALVEIFVADQVAQAKNQGLSLTFHGDPDLPYVQSDMRQIGQVVSILITNALSYTPDGGQIVVSTKSHRDAGTLWATLRIQDTGPGILPADQQYLFERFFRGQTGRESSHPGTGLGLAIAKEIIDRHHGRIEVISDGIPGAGTTFIVWLPT